MQERIRLGTIGSIAVGVRVQEGVILSGSKKASYGQLKITATSKVVTLIDNVGFAFAGQIADMDNLRKILRYEMTRNKLTTERRMTTSAIANLLGNVLYSSKLFPYISFSLIGGYDKFGENGPHLYTLDPIGSVLEEKYAAGGLSQDIAIGLLEEQYDETLNIDEAQHLVEETMKTLASRDVLAGREVDIARITKEGAEIESKKLEV
ncbi:MAG: proteasome subunit beta [Candidatus Korarchaeota archaeon]|nr:proteasome subunit beta [Candidatus Korarchaeota archaeon]NIU84675.1 proteasome subunit beta [Candidatus Thorarchaeota archaeon]NIW14696.1 proteasome subunit beta [Candidatus Thorarchaeota archaeon]NIW52767.1 proteasome subunit beta [Candidatus Korarchaeota archaeon]